MTVSSTMSPSQGTAERLTMHLVEEHSVVDPTYIEDFLLTYRTFLSSPMVVGKKLLEWFHDPSLRDKVWAECGSGEGATSTFPWGLPHLSCCGVSRSPGWFCCG